MASGKVTKVINQKGVYSNVSLTEDASQIAFLTDKDDYDAEKPAVSLYVWSAGKAKLRAKAGDEGLNEGWSISKSNVSFSKSGKRVFFSTKPPALPEKLDIPDDEKVSVDIWNWKDPLLMPNQLLIRSRLENMSFMAYVSTETGQIVQAGDEAISSWSFDRDRDSDYALGRDSMPYLQIRSWGDVPSDVYLLDAKSGRRTLLLKTHFGSASLTPGGRYVIAADAKEQKVYSINVKTKKKVELTENTHDHFFNEFDDHPSVPGWLGMAGSTTNDDRIFLNSSFDVWSIDPSGEAAPKCVTSRTGRRRQIQFRLNRLGSTETHVDVSKPVLLSSNSKIDYTSRYAWGNFEHGAIPVTALEADGNVSGLRKAKNSDAVTYTIQRFDVAPDIHASTTAFGEPTKLTDLQRQLEPYRWGKAELVHWTGNDGQKLDGIVYVPDNLDLSKKHPMITYFYEKSASGLHRFRSPAPSASVINFPLFVSQGYVIFVPDINYKIGYPGESAMSAIMPGVHKVVDLGFVDEKRIGLEGQSWGGYQIAHMVTRTDMFNCAWAGAPVSNMFSAYGGIRTGSGLVRAMQYEVGQSRIGGTIWDEHLRYLENSPLFYVDKINTPLAIMSNDNDGAVPHAQGIELFAALRRLQKPSWMVVYNDEGHNLMQRKNRKDLSIRLSQFFDHFLKGAPAPVWMTDGVPAVMKGRTMGTELKGEKKEKKG